MIKYSAATFRILVDGLVQVEVSVKGCDGDRDSVTPQQLRKAARTMDRIGRALAKIQQAVEQSIPATAHSSDADPLQPARPSGGA